MKESDWELLQGLSLLTDLSKAQWDIVVSDVEKAGGVRQVSGQARVEIERAATKARTLVVKHPGQHDQSVHGGKGKGGGSAPASGDGASNPKAPSGSAQLKEASTALDGAASLGERIGKHHTTVTTGGTRERIAGEHGEMAYKLKSAQKNLAVAQKMNGVDKGTRDKALREAKRNLDSIKPNVKALDDYFGTTFLNMSARTNFLDKVDETRFMINEVLDGGL
jgi:hypothetical protein